MGVETSFRFFSLHFASFRSVLASFMIFCDLSFSNFSFLLPINGEPMLQA